MERFNTRPHAVTRRCPVDMLAEERARLHRLPDVPFTAAFGVTRRVPENTPMVSFDAGLYSVPHELAGQTVWARRHGEQVVFVHVGADGPVEVARHAVTTPGNPRVDDAHFPPAPDGALERTPRPKTAAEAAFLAIGEGARLWLTEAAAAGTTRMRVKMAEAVQLARLHPAAAVDRALGEAAAAGRFGDGDLASILAHHAIATADGEQIRASEDHTLAQGTAGWAAIGATTTETGEGGRA
jgi:hypothetical protein